MAINVENYFEQKLKFDQITNPGKTLEQVKADFQKAGVSAEDHYKKWGWAELLSLDTDFDVAQYLAAKAELDGKTVEQVIADFKKAGVNPQEHYEKWGKAEGLTPVAVGATPGEGEGEEPGTPNTLTEALEALTKAQAEKLDFLEEVAVDSEAVADQLAAKSEVKSSDIEAAIKALATSALADLEAAGNAAGIAGKVGADRTDTYNQAIIQEQQAVYANKVVLAKEDTATVKGLDAANVELKDAQEALADAVKAEAANAVNFAGVKAEFEEANASQTVVVQYGDITGAKYDSAAKSGDVDVTALEVDDVLAIVGGTDAVVVNKNGQIALTDEIVAKKLEGIQELFAAIKSQVAAFQAVANENESLAEAVSNVLLLDGAVFAEVTSITATGYTVLQKDGKLFAAKAVSTTTPKTVELYSVESLNADAAANGVLSNFVANVGTDKITTVEADDIDTAIGTGGGLAAYTKVDATTKYTPSASNFEKLGVSSFINLTATGADNNYLQAIFSSTATKSAALNTALNNQEKLEAAIKAYAEAKELNADLKEYNDAVEAARKVIESPAEDGGLDTTVLKEGTTKFTNDSDLYVFNPEAGNVTLTKFGAKGLDQIFFGKDYVLVELGDDSIEGRVGEVDVLEIFWEQTVSGLVLYVEQEAFAGNVKGINEDIITITLAGVKSADVDLDGGFLAAGTAA